MNPANLAQRNLLRGLSMGLPSGQDVARAMGVAPIADGDLRVGKAVLAQRAGGREQARVARRGANLRGSVGLSLEQIAQAILDERTMLP